MVDAAISRVQQVAESRPVIFSAYLPRREHRNRFLLAFDERTVIQLDLTGACRYKSDPLDLAPAGENDEIPLAREDEDDAIRQAVEIDHDTDDLYNADSWRIPVSWQF